MKRIEDIEMMEVEDLLKVAEDSSVPVPKGLESRLRETLLSQKIAEEAERDEVPAVSLRTRWITGLALAAACTVAAVFLHNPAQGELKDTFDDPRLAYAEVEKTFERISMKMSKASEMAYEATNEIGKPASIIRKINRK
ncbi:MAG: hypothetical protein J6Y40_08435 [Bacteroidales bacterium]|nr:hypothetical protein [Bacteroidales bacterium]